MPSLHDQLRNDLALALTAKNRGTVRVLRTVLSAIGNAAAQPNLDDTPTSLPSEGVIAGATGGVGSTEAERRTLGDQQQITALIAAERADLLACADVLESHGALTQPGALRAQPEVDKYLARGDDQRQPSG